MNNVYVAADEVVVVIHPVKNTYQQYGTFNGRSKSAQTSAQ